MNLESILSEKKLNDLGIVDWGYCESDESLSYKRYEDWVERGEAGVLSYLTDERKEKRKKLSHYFSDYSSALVFAFSYADKKAQAEKLYSSDESNGFKIASYALAFEGQDYHHYLKERLLKISKELKEVNPDLETALSLDVHPILERDLAHRAGLGWFGKNSMLINQKEGSFFILGSLLLSKKMSAPKKEMDIDHCGTCRACIDACPTDAINEEKRTIIANKCISTFTIELFKESPAPKGMNKGSGEIFGCDICQDVCPWNKKRLEVKDEDMNDSKLTDFFLKRDQELIIENLEKMSNREFKRQFKDTAVARTGRVGILKNLRFWNKLFNRTN